jgi:hypothetical protein
MASRDGYGGDGSPPTLAVRLMSVAAEYELQTRRERQRWEDKVADLKAANADLEQQNWTQSQQLEALSRKLEAAIAEMQKFSDSHVGAARTPVQSPVCAPSDICSASRGVRGAGAAEDARGVCVWLPTFS